jgi:heme o synthase
MTRYQRLTLITLAATYLLVVIGAIVRGTGSGMGCPDWPLCYGRILPAFGDTAAWIEWTHRTVAATIGLLVLGIAVLALRDHRRDRSIVGGSVLALALTGFQAYLGKVTVDTGNAAPTVTAHLAAAMVLLAVLAFLPVRSRYTGRFPARGASQRVTLVIGFAAASVFALLLFGAAVTASGASLVFPDWPLFAGQLLPDFSADPTVAELQMTHFVHRLTAAIVGAVVLAATLVVWRAARRRAGSGAPRVPAIETLLGLVGTAAALYSVQVIVGGVQIVSRLAPWSVALHLALGAAIWALLVTAAFVAYFAARTTDGDAAPSDDRIRDGHAREERARTDEHGVPAAGISASVAHVPAPAAPASRRDRVRAYIALTKPRIIELLLVTTLPAMILAQRGLPRLDLIAWTLIGGSLAAGAANAINCYLDRDIDQLMTRTRRRPLPAHEVQAEDALVFGLALGVVAFGVLAAFVNLVAAFLALLAMAFYVVVYTMLLKRSTPQNIVLGGAAGALPPVIGWAAVTGDITLPALLLFAIVFYWTPPHFWALSLRLARDYEAARVPMLPVTHGVRETTRQIALYSVLMVALTLIFFAVARMGLVFLGGSLLLGGMFLFQAFAMWREGTDRRAVRLYKFSISYLTALFALIVVDVFVFVPFAV